jgi:hypothetical protein
LEGSPDQPAHRCKPEPNVTTLLERHNAAWDKCNAAWATGPDAPHRDVERLVNTEITLRNAKPASMAEFFVKWRQLAKFDAELGDADYTHPPIVTQMLDELQAINAR